jgi:thiosulfate/3-mercaptopyruvate sulfurtransferase
VVKVLDCTYENEKEEFYKERIPGSIYFDISEISKGKIITNEEIFIDHMKRLNIKANDIIVCYDRKGIYSSPYVWYNFITYGAKDVFVLDGGFPQWKKEKLHIEKEDEKLSYINLIEEKDEYGFKLNKDNLVGIDYVIEKISKKGTVVDARSKEDFEEWNIPDSVNLDSKVFLNENGLFKSQKEIRNILKKSLSKRDYNVIISNEMLSACIDMFAIEYAGYERKAKLYNDSWDEILVKYFNKEK